MNTRRRIAAVLSAILTVASLSLAPACSDWFMEDPDYYHYFPPVDSASVDIDITATTKEDYEKLCIRTEYYFCPGVSGPLMRIEITKDVCEDPPIVLSMSECKEHLECDPYYYDLGEKSCTDINGMPGSYSSYCVKGFIEEGPCEGSHFDNQSEEPNADDVISSAPEDDLGLSVEKEEVYSCGPNDKEPSCEKEDVDILMIIDLSASMIPEIQSVYNAVQAFSIEHDEAEHVNWALIVGPKNAGNKPGNHNFLYLASNLQSIDNFKYSLNEVLTFDMIGQYEMLYDALYLSIRNISPFLPYQWEELLWPVWIGNVIDESVPALEEFYVNWRENSKKIIIVFTDEPGQSFLIPASKVGKSYNSNDTITQEKLVMMLESIDNMRLFAFTDIADKDSSSAWWPLTAATSGQSFELNSNDISASKQLEEIFTNEICY